MKSEEKSVNTEVNLYFLELNVICVAKANIWEQYTKLYQDTLYDLCGNLSCSMIDRNSNSNNR